MKPSSKWRDRAVMLMPPLPWDRPQLRDRSGPLVVLLHGLWRGWRAMEPLSRALGNEGFATLNIPYPSSRLPIPALADHVRKEVGKIAAARPVHIITHSLGGIIARSLMADPIPWQLGRVVMLAPPNGGSEIVDWASRHPLFHRLLGPAGQALGSQGLPNQLPALPADAEVAVIMGNRSPLPVFKCLLEETNDGIVSASRGNLQGLSEFTIIDADHTFIQMHPEAIRLILEFLKSGRWNAVSPQPSAQQINPRQMLP
ncbi:MAG: alpha/beta fold hydrolase [Gloeobacteraceae cyanobacterium ES-bin-144]|nr:alpha/beta fold hydrolase [Verrucomicrobiales bacterium]